MSQRAAAPGPGPQGNNQCHARRRTRNPYFILLKQFVAGDQLARGPLPDLKPRQILAWADAHCARTGAWPMYTSGRIPRSHGEDWLGIEAALFLGLRSLPTICRFLHRHRGKRNPMSLPPLRVRQILSWADEWPARTGTMRPSTSSAIR
jgi:hypothetical protein